MSADLIIHGAAYGPKDVTGKVRSLRRDQKLSFTVSNDTLGVDPWKGIKKSLVVVYKYEGNSQVNTIIVEEGKQLAINPSSNLPSCQDRLKCSRLSAIQQVTSRQKRSNNQALVILGAAYGLQDVTMHANSLLSNGEFNKMASNDVWGDTWPGIHKTLVVVYAYDGLEMLDVVKENQRMHFIASPPMSILNAAYGLTDVTSKVRSLVKNRSLTVTANNPTFDDGWHGHKKTLVVTYQYGEEIPMVAIAKEDEMLEILYSKGDVYIGPTNPTVLTILGAAYGPKDVTKNVQHLVKDDTLNVQVKNDVLGGDPWQNIKKSLVVVYQYGRNMPLMKIAPENEDMSISKNVPPPFTGLVDASNVLHDGDNIALKAINGKYISCDSNNMLVAVEAVPSDICMMIVQKDGEKFKIRCSSNGKYVTVGAGSVLYATGSVEEATLFSISISLKGALRVAANGMFINFDSDNNCFRANSVDYFSIGTIFDIAIKKTEDHHVRKAYPLELTDCELAWASFIWQLTGGFFLAIGLGPFISTGKVQTGVFGLIKSNQTAWRAIQPLYTSITQGKSASALIPLMLSVIRVLYNEELLWKIFKMMMAFGSWFAITWVLAKIIQVVFLPETEAAELLASFTAWGVQMVQAGLELGRACD